MSTANLSSQLPFFEVDCNLDDNRYGSIKASHRQRGPLGVLDYFHETSGSAESMQAGKRLKSAFFVTRLAFIDKKASPGLERALLYIAACIADERGEQVLYCRQGRFESEEQKPCSAEANGSPNTLWEVRGVRDLLDNYDALVQAV